MPDLTFGIRITADGTVYVNNVRAAATETDKLGNAARGAGQGVESMTMSLTRATAIGATFGNFISDGIRFLGRWAVSTITQAANLKDLADQTGSSVENLSHLTNSFRISGLGTEVLSTALQRLSINLSRQDEEGRRASRALEALGISTKDPAEAMLQLAQRLDKYADGANKAALVEEALGRGARFLLPALKDLAERHDTAATTSQHQAEEAEKLEKGLRALTGQTNALRDEILSGLVPALNTLLETTRQFGATGFLAAVTITPKDQENVVQAIVDTRAKIATLKEEIQALSADTLAAKLNRLFSWEDLKILNEQLAIAQARLSALEKIGAEKPDVWDLQGKQQAPAVPKATTASVSEFTHELERAQKQLVDSKLALEDFGKAADQKTTPAMRTLIEAMNSPAWAKYSAAERDALATTLQAADANQRRAAGMKDAAEQEKQWATDAAKYAAERKKQYEDDVAGGDKVIEKIKEQNETIQAEYEVIGESNLARDLRLSKLQHDRELQAAVTDEQKKEVDELYRDRDALLIATDARKAWNEEQQRSAEQAGESIRNLDEFARGAFQAIGTEGQDAFKDIGRAIKTYLLDVLYQLTLRKWVISIGASLFGLGGEAAAQAAGPGMNLSWLGNLFGSAGGATSGSGLLGSLFSGAGNLFGGSGGGLFGGLGSLFGGATYSAAEVAANASIMAGFGGTSTMAAGGLLAGVGTVLPWLGIGLAIASMFSGKGGGPKSGGFAASGAERNLLNVDRDNNRYYTPSDRDSDVQKIVDSIQSSYSQTLTALGGTGSATFGLGFDTDPQGSAQNRVSAGAVVNGRSVYNVRNREVGRDDASLQTQLTLESQRALLAALQASELPENIAKVINKVVASSATQDQIDSALKMATAIKTLTEAVKDVDPVKDANEAWRLMNRSATQALKEQGDALRTLAANVDGTVDNTNALATATVAYRQALVATLVQIRQVQQAVSAMFAGTREQLETSGLSGQDLYNYYRDKANARMADLSSADPAVVNAAAEDINRYLLAAFGALTPEDQAAMKGPLLDYLAGIDSFVQQHLDDLFATTADTGKGPLDDVSVAIGTAADKFDGGAANIVAASTTQMDAANIMVDAATKISLAADKMQNITVTMRPAGEVNG